MRQRRRERVLHGSERSYRKCAHKQGEACKFHGTTNHAVVLERLSRGPRRTSALDLAAWGDSLW